MSAVAGIGVVAYVVFDVWLWPSFMIAMVNDFRPNLGARLRRSPLGWLRYELMPVRYAAVLVAHGCDVIQGQNTGFWGSFFFVMFMLNCWLYRQKDDEDDDRWKRRRKKLASKVAEVGGRLQVLPAGAS